MLNINKIFNLRNYKDLFIFIQIIARKRLKQTFVNIKFIFFLFAIKMKLSKNKKRLNNQQFKRQ